MSGVGEKEWINMDATQFTLGRTAFWTWTGSSVDPGEVDSNIRTALTLVSSSQDFDFRITFDDTTANGPSVGFHTTGTTDTIDHPSTTNPIVYARNAGGANPGWNNNDGSVEAAKSAGWMSGVGPIQISRRGSTFYGLINGVLDRTFTGTTGTNAGGFFIGCAGATHAWQVDSVQYRLGPGLPAIA